MDSYEFINKLFKKNKIKKLFKKNVQFFKAQKEESILRNKEKRFRKW
jgi:hypothetical protein